MLLPFNTFISRSFRPYEKMQIISILKSRNRHANK
jgi:hypothetical protein